MSAKTHTQSSNREKQREDRKTVFKGVFDNPFKIQWPHIPLNVQNSCLAALISTLDGVSEYQEAKDMANRKRKRAAHEADPKRHKKQRKETEMAVDETTKITHNETTKTIVDETPVPSPPPILSHLCIGINHVTKLLEAQLKASTTQKIILTSATDPVPAQHVSSTPLPPPPISSTPLPPPPITLVFVCRADIDPPILIDHIPHLIAACNSHVHTKKNPIQLVVLPKGAEASLAHILGIRRVAILSLNSGADLSIFSPLLDRIPTVTASWLEAATSSKALVPTHIKTLKTSAPKDMKAAKEKRTQERADAKQKRAGERDGTK